ncbi:MAG: hypothetical protein EKK37_00800 [Sphingobacteriales bacterium]|nr:MAG: hypothetical protein EKK37_00800 [Sphingobacteriales bacterium]
MTRKEKIALLKDLLVGRKDIDAVNGEAVEVWEPEDTPKGTIYTSNNGRVLTENEFLQYKRQSTAAGNRWIDVASRFD